MENFQIMIKEAETFQKVWLISESLNILEKDICHFRVILA